MRFDETWDKHWAGVETTVAKPDAWYLTDILKLEHLVPALPSQGKILEVGCGSARLSYFLASMGQETYGLDYSAQALRVANQNFHRSGQYIRLTRADGACLPFADDRFDVVMSTGLLEHFVDPKLFVREMVRVLKPGGLFYSDIVPFKFSTFRAKYFLQHARNIEGREEHAYRGHDIENWLEAAGLRDIQVTPAVILPPLGLIRRSKVLLAFLFKCTPLLHRLDGTFAAEALGLLYIALAYKTAQPR